MSSRTKRFRGGVVVPRARTTRVDKKLIAVAKLTLSTTQLTTDLITATFPCTITGLRWEFTVLNLSSTGNPTFRWAIVRLKDGVTISTTSITDAADFYTPEQEVLTFGIGTVSDTDGTVGPRSVHFSGSTKSMRKLMGGDKLVFLAICDVASVQMIGIVQFFCRI